MRTVRVDAIVEVRDEEDFLQRAFELGFGNTQVEEQAWQELHVVLERITCFRRLRLVAACLELSGC